MPRASAVLLRAPYSELLLPLPLFQRKSPGLGIVPTPASSGKSSLQNVSQGHPLSIENTLLLLRAVSPLHTLSPVYFTQPAPVSSDSRL